MNITNDLEVKDADWTEEFEDTLKDKYLTFHIGNEDYGIAIRYVTEIIGIQKITEIPESENYVKGVINLRGKVIPVMDVRLRFGLSEREYDERTCVIVVRVEETTVGLVVDTVSEVLSIPADQVEPNVNQSGNKESYVEGLGKLEDDIKILIDIHKLLYTSQGLKSSQQKNP